VLYTLALLLDRVSLKSAAQIVLFAQGTFNKITI
jgi:hypothetical protein